MLLRYKISANELLKILFKAYKTNGWGLAELVEKRCKKVFVMRVYKCFEALSRPNAKTEDISYDFNRGFWSGALTGILDMKMRVTEEKYFRKGDSYYEFKVKLWD